MSTRRTSPRRRAAAKRISYKDVDDNEDDDFSSATKVIEEDKLEKIDSSQVGVKKCPNKDRLQNRTTGNSKSKAKPETKNQSTKNIESKVCPHCRKKFTTIQGSTYHMENSVCRPEKAKSKVKKNFPRGDASNLICSSCKRVFTSVLGLNYHLEKNVCKKTSKQSSLAFPSLTAGAMFVTTFGIVKVIKDDRAKPMAKFPPDVKQQMKLFTNSLLKREAKSKNHLSNVAVKSRIRRMLLQRAYLKGQHHDATTVEQAYGSGKNVRSVIKKPMGIPLPTKINPEVPTGSHADRIVECVLVPDKRRRLLLDGSTLPGANAISVPNNVRLYLTRRSLTEVYSSDSVQYYCHHCWTVFTCKTSLKYHVEHEICIKKAASTMASRASEQEIIEERVQYGVSVATRKEFKRSPYKVVWLGTEAEGFRGRDGKFQGSRVPKRKDIIANDECAVSETTKEKNGSVQPAIMKDLVSPDDVYNKLEAELYFLQGKMMGPIYPQVFESLGFKDPVKMRKRRRKKYRQSDEMQFEQFKNDSNPIFMKDPPESLTDALSEPMAPPTLGVPVIDTRVLAAEVESGRYPSLHRYTGVHDKVCAICQDKGDPKTLIKCDFCRTIEHISCLNTKFIVHTHYPEPDDDIMCHRCIGVIVSRRGRAERRRLDKLYPGSDPNDYEVNAATQWHDRNQFLQGVVPPHREHECVATQCSNIEDLVELLRDAKARLSLTLEHAFLNRTRQTLLDALATEET